MNAKLHVILQTDNDAFLCHNLMRKLQDWDREAEVSSPGQAVYERHKRSPQ